MVKNPRQGFDPWPGEIPHALEERALRSTAIELVLQSQGAVATEPVRPEPVSTTREATAVRIPSTAMTSRPQSPQLEKSPCSNEDSAQSRINSLKRKKKNRKDEQ